MLIWDYNTQNNTMLGTLRANMPKKHYALWMMRKMPGTCLTRNSTRPYLLAHAVVRPVTKDQEVGCKLDILSALWAEAIRVKLLRVLIALSS